MIEDLLTSDTKVFEFIKNQELDSKERELKALKISRETSDPLEVVKGFEDRWYYKNGKWFFVKTKDYDFHFVNELLGEVISIYFGLDTVNYQIAKVNSSYGLASMAFGERNSTYKLVSDYKVFPIYSLKDLDNINSICTTKLEYLKLLRNIKKILIRDFYTSQADRFGKNILLKENTNGISLAPLFDYEKSFYKPSVITFNHLAKLDITNREDRKILKNDLDFQEQLVRLYTISIFDLLKEVEDRHGIKINSYLKEKYLNHDIKVKSLIKDYKLLK